MLSGMIPFPVRTAPGVVAVDEGPQERYLRGWEKALLQVGLMFPHGCSTPSLRTPLKGRYPKIHSLSNALPEARIF